MASYSSTLRAVAAVYAKRIIRLVTVIGVVIFILLIIGTALLAAYVSNYWWLALIFILPISIIVSILLILSLLVANAVQGKELRRPQEKLVGAFVDKLQSVVERTQLSFGFVLFIIAKDLLFHRNLKSLEAFIGDSNSLKRDLDELAKKL